MTERENAIRILSFDSPQKIIPGMPLYGIDYFGCNHEGFDGTNESSPVGSVWQDVWGVTWKKEFQEMMGLPISNPLSNPQALNNYIWPDPNDPRLITQIYEKHKGYQSGSDLFLAGGHRDTLWEKSYMLVGMENMMEYFYSEPNFAREILHRIMDFQLGIAMHYISCGIEVACLGDDLGTQHSLLLSPNIIREFLVPEYKRIFDLYKKHNVFICFHSCGKIEKVLDIFMELGVDALNPIQVSANNLEFIREKTQGRMTLHGGISSQLLMEGTTEQIEQAVRDTILILGKKGGYFCCPDQGMPYPKKSLEAYERALKEYGDYTWINSCLK